MPVNASDRITLKQIRVFLAAAEYENFSLAAERLYITQPLVSHTIAQLESDLGYPLFDREKKQVRLNSAGRVLRDKLQNVSAWIDSAVESSRQAWLDLKPQFVVSLPMSVDTESFFFPIFPLFKNEYPNIRLKTDQMEIGSAIQSVAAGAVDLAFTVFPEVFRFQSLPIAWEEVCPCATYAEVPSNSPLCGRSSLLLSDLIHEPLALISEDGVFGYTQSLLGLFAERGLKPTSTYYVSSTAALDMTSALGEGVALATAISSPKSRGKSRRIPILDAPNGVIAFWRKGASSPILRCFISLARKHLQRCLNSPPC